MKTHKPINVCFSDLTHTGQVIASNTVPLGLAFVASYADLHLGDDLDIEVFKYPSDLSGYLEKKPPQMACFSNYSWNIELSYHYVKKIKEVSPNTIIVFGGPNYPVERSEQLAFLEKYPLIDFYVWLEGEKAFVSLCNELDKFDYDASLLKRRNVSIPSIHYLDGENFIRSDNVDRLKDLSEIPSPYLSGMCDKFFDDVLIPLIQTNRGCPYQCTFCTEGQSYYNKINWSNTDRVAKDLEYIAKRSTVPDLIIVDSNFGMFKQDLDVCRSIARLQEEYRWPKHIHVSAGKNKKKMVVEAATIVNGAINLAATVQSTSETVLENVKRRNIALDQLIDVGKEAEKLGANSYSEVILCLPGDTIEAHFSTIFSMIGIGINFLRMYQLMMLPGGEMSSVSSRKEYEMVTKFRVLPRCFGNYQIYGDSISVYEIEEICVANNTMSYQHYLDCRMLNLTVEIFYNSSIFKELTNYLNIKGVETSELISKIHGNALSGSNALQDIYMSFRDETHGNLWSNREELVASMSEDGAVDRYISGELGSNELFKYRAKAFFYRQNDLHNICFDAAKNILDIRGLLECEVENYLDQLMMYSLKKKEGILDVNTSCECEFSYDFIAMENFKFQSEPVKKDCKIVFSHSSDQIELMNSYVKQYGNSLNGLGRILLRSHVNKLFRCTSLVLE